jgi:hypothetical protein
MERLYVWVASAVGWSWALLLLWIASGGIINIVEVLALFPVAALTGTFWLSGGAFAKALKWRDWLAWGSVPVVWLAALVLSANDVPMFVRFHLSESALRRYAEGTDPDPPDYTKSAKYIGLFHVDKVWRHERMVAFRTDGKPFLSVGVMYAPDGLPKELPMEVEELLYARYTHISGPWYRFEVGD